MAKQTQQTENRKTNRWIEEKADMDIKITMQVSSIFSYEGYWEFIQNYRQYLQFMFHALKFQINRLITQLDQRKHCVIISK